MHQYHDLLERILRSEEHTSELQSPDHLVCRLLLEKKKKANSHPARCPYARQNCPVECASAVGASYKCASLCANISPCGTQVLASASTLEAEVRQQLSSKGSNIAAATFIGHRIAQKAKAAGIESLAFDRSGFRYHGRVRALAEAAREAGLKF